MNVNFNDILYAFSYGLDYVEHGILGITTHHARRVAYISASIGRALNMTDHKLLDLVSCAILHDCALVRYLPARGRDEREYAAESALPVSDELTGHCILGEEDIRLLPFYTDMHGTVLYHHENFDGTGPFHKQGSEIPETAQLIHLADRLDVECHLGTSRPGQYEHVQDFLIKNRNCMFSSSHVDLFLDLFQPDLLKDMQNGRLDILLKQDLPQHFVSYDGGQLHDIATFFAKIIDYKSSFTSRHSIGIAEKAKIMAAYYGYDEELQEKLYFAGAVHDIGKLAVSNGILEKPGKLDDKEYAHIKTHAWYTWKILSGIQGIDDITKWASYHHEKLNGKGYPFGKTAAELDKNSRLMACLDIYQALTEPRPYKDGYSHEKAISIMRDMAAKDYIDLEITEDINHRFLTHDNHQQEAYS